MSNLSRLLDRYKALVIFDTETSGLNPGDDQIIELAALRVERTQTGALRIAGCLLYTSTLHIPIMSG